MQELRKNSALATQANAPLFRNVCNYPTHQQTIFLFSSSAPPNKSISKHDGATAINKTEHKDIFTPSHVKVKPTVFEKISTPSGSIFPKNLDLSHPLK